MKWFLVLVSGKESNHNITEIFGNININCINNLIQISNFINFKFIKNLPGASHQAIFTTHMMILKMLIHMTWKLRYYWNKFEFLKPIYYTIFDVTLGNDWIIFISNKVFLSVLKKFFVDKKIDKSQMNGVQYGSADKMVQVASWYFTLASCYNFSMEFIATQLYPTN